MNQKAISESDQWRGTLETTIIHWRGAAMTEKRDKSNRGQEDDAAGIIDKSTRLMKKKNWSEEMVQLD
jgi:hypothetical protein